MQRGQCEHAGSGQWALVQYHTHIEPPGQHQSYQGRNPCTLYATDFFISAQTTAETGQGAWCNVEIADVSPSIHLCTFNILLVELIQLIVLSWLIGGDYWTISVSIFEAIHTRKTHSESWFPDFYLNNIPDTEVKPRIRKKKCCTKQCLQISQFPKGNIILFSVNWVSWKFWSSDFSSITARV